MNPVDGLGRHDSWDGRPCRRRRARRLRLRRRRQLLAPRRRVTVVDDGGDGRARARRPSCSRPSASRCGSARAPPRRLPDDIELIVTSPGWRPDAPLFAQAAERGVPVWGEVELAWRLRDPGARRALARRHRHQRQDHDRADARRDPARRRAAHRRRRQHRLPAARGRAGPGAVRRAGGRAVQLPAALRRLAARRTPPPSSTSPPDHLDWHGSMDGVRRRQGPDLRAATSSPASTTSPTRPPRSWCARPTSWRAAARSASPSARPAVGMLGVVDGHAGRPGLRRGARDATRPSWHARRPTVPRPPAPHNVANALAAAALARAYGVPPGRRPRRAARLPPGRAPDRARGRRRRGHLRRRLQGHQPPRRAGLAARPTSRSCGSPAGWPRAPPSTSWSRSVARPAARRRAARPRPRRDPRSARATRARCPVIDVGPARRGPTDWSDGSHATRRGRRGRSPGRATPCCWPRPAPHGHVRQLRRARRRVRRGGQELTGVATGRRRRPDDDRERPRHPTPPHRAAAGCRPGCGCAAAGATWSRPESPVRPRGWLGSLRARAGPAADGVLPGPRRLGAAARPRPDHGAARLERLLATRSRRRLLRRSSSSSCIWVADRAPAAPGSPPGCRTRCSGRSPTRCCSVSLVLLPAHGVLGVEVNGNQNWLSSAGPDPALRVRQARAGVCGARTSTPARSSCSPASKHCSSRWCPAWSW